jgi:hypothetical protein
MTATRFELLVKIRARPLPGCRPPELQEPPPRLQHAPPRLQHAGSAPETMSWTPGPRAVDHRTCQFEGWNRISRGLDHLRRPPDHLPDPPNTFAGGRLIGGDDAGSTDLLLKKEDGTTVLSYSNPRADFWDTTVDFVRPRWAATAASAPAPARSSTTTCASSAAAPTARPPAAVVSARLWRCGAGAVEAPFQSETQTGGTDSRVRAVMPGTPVV